MAITFPRTGFLLLTPIAASSPPFRLASRQEISRTAGGDTRAADLGPALWRFDWTTVPIRKRAAIAVQAYLESLDGAVGSLLLYDVTRQRPAASTLESFGSAQIHTVGDGLRLKGLPAGTVLTPGDMLGVTVSGRRHLHAASEAATADGSGVTPLFEVRPAPRPGLAADQAVTLVRPLGEFVLEGWSAQAAGPVHLQFSLSGVER